MWRCHAHTEMYCVVVSSRSSIISHKAGKEALGCALETLQDSHNHVLQLQAASNIFRCFVLSTIESKSRLFYQKFCWTHPVKTRAIFANTEDLGYTAANVSCHLPYIISSNSSSLWALIVVYDHHLGAIGTFGIYLGIYISDISVYVYQCLCIYQFTSSGFTPNPDTSSFFGRPIWVW